MTQGFDQFCDCFLFILACSAERNAGICKTIVSFTIEPNLWAPAVCVLPTVGSPICERKKNEKRGHTLMLTKKIDWTRLLLTFSYFAEAAKKKMTMKALPTPLEYMTQPACCGAFQLVVGGIPNGRDCISQEYFYEYCIVLYWN
jgi:hypothetical protein